MIDMGPTAEDLEGQDTPFLAKPWRGEEAGAALAFWLWYKALESPINPDLGAEHRQAFFDSQHDAVLEDGDVTVAGRDVWQAVRAHATSRRRREWLAEQARSAAAYADDDGLHFADRTALSDFIRRRVVPHARLLADLAGAASGFQGKHVEALAEGFFLESRLRGFMGDLKKRRIFFTDDELADLRLAPEDLAVSPPPERVRKLVWRRIVWARDAFARGMPLADQLDRRFARSLRTHVLTALERLAKLERNKYDVASFDPALSRYHRLQAMFQARFGRTPWR